MKASRTPLTTPACTFAISPEPAGDFAADCLLTAKDDYPEGAEGLAVVIESLRVLVAAAVQVLADVDGLSVTAEC